MEWIKTIEKLPNENQKVEFPADKERDGIIQGYYSDKCFWSSFEGFHEPKIWRPYNNPNSNSVDPSIDDAGGKVIYWMPLPKPPEE